MYLDAPLSDKLLISFLSALMHIINLVLRYDGFKISSGYDIWSLHVTCAFISSMQCFSYLFFDFDTISTDEMLIGFNLIPSVADILFFDSLVILKSHYDLDELSQNTISILGDLIFLCCGSLDCKALGILYSVTLDFISVIVTSVVGKYDVS